MSNDPSKIPYLKYDPRETVCWTGRLPTRMCELEASFEQDGNSIYLVQATRDVLSSQLPMPKWVRDHLLASMEQILNVVENARNKPAGKQAEMVGRALGFGAKGRGGRVRQAVLTERDERMFSDVARITRPLVRISGRELHYTRGHKLDTAYNIVAADWGVSRSVTIRACGRFLRRWRAAVIDSADLELTEAIKSMRSFVRFQLRSYDARVELDRRFLQLPR